MTRRVDDMSARELEEHVDAGGDVSELFDGRLPIERPACQSQTPSRIVITPPDWLVTWLDEEAERRGVTRRGIINTALVEWADEQRERARRLNTPA